MRILLACLLLSLPAWSQQKARSNQKPRPAARATAPSTPVSGIVQGLQVEGNKKLEKDAILARVRSKVGEPIQELQIREDILSIFKTGYFFDVQVERKPATGGWTLVYRVLEKPSIVEIVYEGSSEVKKEDIAEASGLKAYEILDMAKVREAVEKIQKLYEDKGYFLAKIDTKVEDVKKDESVKLTFKISESDKVKVKKIIFVGNKKLGESFLKGRMITQEEGYFSPISGSGGYKQEAFERDIQILRLSYYSQGFIRAQVDRPQISVTPDRKGIYVTIRVEEGEQYEVGEIDFAGHLLFPRKELFETIQIDESKIFAYDVLQKDLGELQAKYGDLGYAYANIIPRWVFRKDSNIVDIVFEIDKGNKVYFGRIDVVGNSKTRDKVVRRELKVREGELYNETRRRESLENVQRLGFFEEVNFKTSTPPDNLDVMNVEIVVKERNTGQVQVSAGYGSSTGLTFGGSVQQTNFMGKGQNLGISAQLTSTSDVYDISFTEPYFNDTLWSLGFRAFVQRNSGRFDYDEKKSGGSLTLGHPLGDYTRASVTYSYIASRLSPVYVTNSTTGQLELLTDYSIFPLSTAEGDASSITGSLDYDTRNDRMRPSKGLYARGSLSNTGWLGGNLRYYKASADLRYFKNLFWDVVWRNSLSWSLIDSTDSSRQPPFNELFLLGGPYSLRGYRFARVGRMVFSQQLFDRFKAQDPTLSDQRARDLAMRFFGGKQQVQLMTELQFPMIREAEMYGIVFFDAGQAEDQLSGNNIFADWGFGLRWFSPIGPLRFEWGFPLNRNPLYHENGVFEFSIGTPF